MSYGNYHDHSRSPPRQQSYDEPFNPYDTGVVAQHTYDQGGYGFEGGGYTGGYSDEPAAVAGKESQTATAWDAEDAVPARPSGPKTSRNLRRWRADNQGNLWSRGSPLAIFGRFLCCTILIFFFLVISIVLSLALWIRPPNVVINSPTISQSNPINVTGDSLIVNMDVNVSVNNPNYLSVDFSSITADLTYPLNGNSTPIGGGTVHNVDIKGDELTNFTLPIAIQYNATLDPSHTLLASLASKCGLIPGQSASDLTIDYKIELDMTVLFKVKPVISNSFNFACPISENDIASLLQGLGLSASDLSALLDGLTGSGI